MNLRGFLRQTVTVERKGETNPYGEDSYAAPETIPARIEIKQNRIRNSQGTEVLASTRVMTVEELQVGDLVNGESVVDRENIVDVGGKVLGWISYL